MGRMLVQLLICYFCYLVVTIQKIIYVKVSNVFNTSVGRSEGAGLDRKFAFRMEGTFCILHPLFVV